MTTQSSFDAGTKQTTDEEYTAELEKGPSWTTDNGMRFTFAQNAYSLTDTSAKDEGIFAVGIVAGSSIIQFRSSSLQQILSDSYQMIFDSVTIPATKKHKAEIRINYDTLHLVPVRLSPDTCFPLEGRTLTLTRDKPRS